MAFEAFTPWGVFWRALEGLGGGGRFLGGLGLVRPEARARRLSLGGLSEQRRLSGATILGGLGSPCKEI